MIILRTDMPKVGRNDVWCSELNISSLTPARRDRLAELLSLLGFEVRKNVLDALVGEVVENGENLVIRVG